ncbi:hypothetical protein PILCRDRAFT_822568 [Piloderma croceum F 1598]|uniref:Leucine-rich repeat-containing protein 40 n=1 Tax=Piloderma croceum (strain F 1598) TaxID=765440 RepID=A0A0C3BSX7_PILCF|nr:hypothetical protein PILCRDRAFT_822568 [Piloderma croceum F 1598]
MSSKPKVLVPPTSRSRAASPLKPSSTMASPARARTKSTPQTPSKSFRRPLPQDEPPVPKTAVNIREAIALKRAEVKKTERASSSSRNGGAFDGLEDALPVKTEEEHVDELGRWSVRETIERARSTGSVNLSIRSLPCLPSALFEIHLGITPDPLKSVPNEPCIVTTADTPAKTGRGGRGDGPSWFDSQDLTVLKAWNNEIVEIQPEISLFGSLKTVDLHKNKLVALPESFADLSVLTTLDLSQNALTSLPTKLFALPSLAILNISHNAITALSFRAPFSKASSRLTQSSAGSFFAPVITYATTPLPKLHTLDASHNQLQAGAIDHADADLPIQLSKIDLSGNPLGNSQSLIRALGRLDNLKELRMEKADISDDSIPPDTLLSSTSFPKLRIFDLGQTKITTEAIRTALAPKVKQQLNFDFTTEDPPSGVMRVLVGKPVVKEPWELEAERKAWMRAGKAAGASLGEQDGIMAALGKSKSGEEAAAKESWEIEAEQGLLTEGGRRRARAAAAVAASPAPATPAPKPAKKEIQKEAWEIEAEQGLLTEGGRRRARAAAAEEAKTTETLSSVSTKPSSSGTSLTSPQYYSEKTSTLTLPPSVSASKGHSRAFSHAPSAWPPSRDSRITDIAIPAPTLPLGVIASQPFAQTLKILTLTNRRLDVSLDLPANSESDLLPNLEELNLDGCSLRDTVPVSQHTDQGAGAITPPRVNQPLLPLLVRLFPNLQTLDLSDNVLTAAALQADVLASLILAAPPSSKEFPLHSTRKGLKHLRLRGNRIADLDGLQGLATQFKGNRTVPEWKLEELDLRDNEIGRLPPELGLLPLDIFLVDGNVFRVPQRRVWEREGTKGLLSWLRGRIE